MTLGEDARDQHGPDTAAGDGLEGFISTPLWKRSVLAALTVMAILAASHSSQAGVSRENGYASHLGELINTYRSGHRLKPLAMVEPLSALAQEHAARMAEAQRLSHDGYEGRFSRADATICVENVGWNYPTPKDAFEAWRNSTGHNANLLNTNVTKMGLAAERNYVVLLACG
jgi:uncharacterized protein YkwD